MKKVISIITLVLAMAAAVFAVSGDKLIVNANVGAHKPVFSMVGGTTNQYGATSNTTGTGTAIINTGVDISTNNVVIYVGLVQAPESSTRIKFKGTVSDLSITATELINTEDATEKTAIPVASSIAGSGTNGGDCYVTASAGATDNVVNFTADYSGHPVAGGVIGTCVFTWTAKDTLPVGNYQASITLSYTAP